MSEIYDAPESPRITRAVQWLLALNIGVYFLQLTLFGSDAVYSALALDPARFPTAWWTVEPTCSSMRGWRISRSICSRSGCSVRGWNRNGGVRASSEQSSDRSRRRRADRWERRLPRSARSVSFPRGRLMTADCSRRQALDFGLFASRTASRSVFRATPFRTLDRGVWRES